MGGVGHELEVYGEPGWVMGLVHLDRLFEIIYDLFNEYVLGGEILKVFFVDTCNAGVYSL